MAKNNFPLISLGSLKSIGYEIFLTSVNKKIFKKNTPVCIGSKKNTDYFIKLLKYKTAYSSYTFEDFIKADNPSIKKNDFILINIDKNNTDFNNINDISDKTDGIYALETLNKAAFLIKNNFFLSVVTLPVNKKNINLTDKKFYGHTEFFQKKWGQSKVFMTFISKKINIMLLTTHIPLKKVYKFITPAKINSMLETSVILKNKLKLNKKTCFQGFNPHAGENGLIGKEDLIIKKAVENFNKTSEFKIDGPMPADTSFIKSNLKKYDLFLSCYHDQGLIPFKMLSFNDGVNLSFGMDYIRTSVDHGTAVDLIGKKTADITSFKNAYKLACLLSS